MTTPAEAIARADWPGVRGSLDEIAGFVERVAEAAGIDARTARRLRLALDEVCTNIVVHGYHDGTSPGRIRIEATLCEDALELTIDDDAPPFDLTAWDAGAVVALGAERAGVVSRRAERR